MNFASQAHAVGVVILLSLLGCSQHVAPISDTKPIEFPAVEAWTVLDLEHLDNYANPELPAHYQTPEVAALDNLRGRPLTDEGATLGRVLFFDQRLSINNSTSCASCHQPEFAFGDTAAFSIGHTGEPLSVRTMRLVNARWYAGPGFLWDRRAATLEEQATQPLVHPLEMGWDESAGGLPELLERMRGLAYYPELFRFVYGDEEITETRLREALAMYVRSIVSTDSKWDRAFAEVFDPSSSRQSFDIELPGLTAEENLGRSLFMKPVSEGGLGCSSCHVPPTFSLDANSLSNGITMNEEVVFKAPSLKSAALAPPFMHNAMFRSLELAIAFYAGFTNAGPALDPRLMAADGGQLRITLAPHEREAVAAFLEALADNSMATDPRFSNPFRDTAQAP